MSGIKPMPSDKLNIAGKTGAEWAKQQQTISAAGSDNLSNELQGNTTVKQQDVDDYLNRLNAHRSMVLDETLQVAQHYKLTSMEQHELVNNVLGHDVDKYTAKVALPYIRKQDDLDAWWENIGQHHSDNPHHPEYWANTSTKRAEQMPTASMIEMVGDWRATARLTKTRPGAYYRANGDNMILHPETRAAAERELGVNKTPFKDLFPDNFKRSKEMITHFRYKGSAKSGNHGHAGIPGRVGGSQKKSTSGDGWGDNLYSLTVLR
jgi:hypothetical protein